LKPGLLLSGLLAGLLAGLLSAGCCWPCLLLAVFVVGRVCCWPSLLLAEFGVGRVCCWPAGLLLSGLLLLLAGLLAELLSVGLLAELLSGLFVVGWVVKSARTSPTNTSSRQQQQQPGQQQPGRPTTKKKNKFPSFQVSKFRGGFIHSLRLLAGF